MLVPSARVVRIHIAVVKPLAVEVLCESGNGMNTVHLHEARYLCKQTMIIIDTSFDVFRYCRIGICHLGAQVVKPFP